MKTASEFDVFSCPLSGRNLIEASAGTGKTWNIGGLYLRLLLEKELEVRQILVVTFTTVAISELRDRIRCRIEKALGYLEGRDAADDDVFLLKLLEKLMREGHDRENLISLLRSAFQSFDQAAIFTIHSFCQRALASTAFSSGYAFSMRVETDDEAMVLESVHDFWRRRLAGGSLSPALSAWLEKRKVTPERLVSVLRQRLRKPLAMMKWPDEVIGEIDTDVGVLETAFDEARKCWSLQRDEIIGLLNDSASALIQKTYKATKIEQAANVFDRFFAAGDPMAMLGNVGKTDLLTVSKVKANTRKNAISPVHPFFECAEKLIDACHHSETRLEIAYLQLLYQFLAETMAVLKVKKREQRLIAYEDMLSNLYEALNNPDMPWLASSLRQQFPAALIDEFQDTDPLQYFIFNTIYKDSDSPVFLVGDPKQAIYSFRNADLYTYFQAKDQVDSIYTLAENHRSIASLIQACNTIFSANPRAFLQSGLDFFPVRSGQDHPILIDETEKESVSGPSLQIWRLPQNDDGQFIGRSEAKIAAINATADEIARLLNAGFASEITIDRLSVQASDMAVLVRSHNEAALVRQALARRGIGSVSLSQESVFASREARELETVLNAIFEPGNERFLKAALVTEMMGLDSAAIEMLDEDEAEMTQWLGRFEEYRQSWLKSGVSVCLHWLIDREGVVGRLLPLADGERRLTNLKHLLELLNQENDLHNAPGKLLRWFLSRREEKKTGEDAQLQLETDRNLVQIMTVHRAKGLEFAFVFCPLLWDGFRLNQKREAEGLEYHEDNVSVIDFRLLSDEEARSIRQMEMMDDAAQDLRLIYVALTRAVYRCYLVAGCYSRTYYGGKPNTLESRRSLLNWLVAGDEVDPFDWLVADRLSADKNEALVLKINDVWQSLPGRCKSISVSDLPAVSFTRLCENRPDTNVLQAKSGKIYLRAAWKMSSFSGLMRGAIEDVATGDHDEYVSSVMDVEDVFDAQALPEKNDILRFPKGTYAGSCLHAMFEQADFMNPDSWPDAVEMALEQFPQSSPVSFGNQGNSDQDLKAMALNMMADVMHTPLPGGFTLANVDIGRRLTELPFCLSETALSAPQLNQFFKRFHYGMPELAFDDMNAYLSGFIDLVFEHEGRFYLLDWKSNHLGNRRENYKPDNLVQAMNLHGYHWQYLLYTVALNRYLSRRLPDYDYENHFGGVLYLFVRGVRPEWKNADGSPFGVFFHKPDRVMIQMLDVLLKWQNKGVDHDRFSY